LAEFSVAAKIQLYDVGPYDHINDLILCVLLAIVLRFLYYCRPSSFASNPPRRLASDDHHLASTCSIMELLLCSTISINPMSTQKCTFLQRAPCMALPTGVDRSICAI
jgi:hypothetical protein